MKIKYVVGIWMLAAWLTACGGKKEEKITSADPVFRKDTTVYVLNGTDTVARFDTELAVTPYEHATGLMYRKEMEPHQAMLFVFPSEEMRFFYMKNTYLPLDVIFADRTGKIVHIHPNAVPLDEKSFSSEKPAKYVLEIKGGLAEKYHIEPGMRLKW